jgi:hypothetical protein
VKRPVGNPRTATTLADSVTRYRRHRRDTLGIGNEGYECKWRKQSESITKSRQISSPENPETSAAPFFFADKSSIKFDRTFTGN